MDKPAPDYNAWLKKYEPIKLKGFKALYYYMYFFGIIRKKDVPQRVSFYMREEIIKFDRYQKQFHFLYNNDIETIEQLQRRKIFAQAEIDELMPKYGKPEKDAERAEVNKKLKALHIDNCLFRIARKLLLESKL